ncbi:alpha/beta fold hydrolase [Streptomyces sp. 1222.5]|uniref:alpha/beta fold hydrolase n=1 Tax=Streptomyces sp. 1222.5 TaxID=1881026 RepID=UPI003D70B541
MNPNKTTLALSALTAATMVTSTASALAATPPPQDAKPTIVLVHGAFADGSSWNKVTEALQNAGYRVVVPANPLRGLKSDSAYVASVLKTIKGPIVFAGHSYGGEVITNAATSNPQVKALVYAAAIAPEKGESANDVLGAYPGSQLPSALDHFAYPLPNGGEGNDLYIKPDKFRAAFAADVAAPTAAAMAAAQRPIDDSALGAKSENATWHTIPSWYLVARNDQAIPATAQRHMAQRAHAHVMEVNSSHAITVSHPIEVTRVIKDAAQSVTGHTSSPSPDQTNR